MVTAFGAGVFMSMPGINLIFDRIFSYYTLELNLIGSFMTYISRRVEFITRITKGVGFLIRSFSRASVLKNAPRTGQNQKQSASKLRSAQKTLKRTPRKWINRWFHFSLSQGLFSWEAFAYHTRKHGDFIRSAARVFCFRG